MSCATELLRPANFCPVCGARLSAPIPDGSAATLPGGTTPAVVPVPAEQSDENVVYLNEESARSGGAIPANPHAQDYDGVPTPTGPPTGPPVPPVTPPAAASEDPSSVVPLHPRGVDPADPRVQELRRRAAEIEAALPPFASHGPLPQQHELVPPPRVDDNPFGDFFADGASAWLEDDEQDEDEVQLDRPRLVGTALATGAVLMLIAAWAVWGIAMYRGSGGAEAGGFLLLSMLLWAWYLSLPRSKQHAAMLRWHVRVQRVIDRPVAPIRDRTEGQLLMRRERDRYRSMRDERTRRVTALGEGAYRSFRQGTLSPELQAGAQRVLAIERQMLAQDQRIHGLVQERQAGGHDGADTAAGEPEGGHPER
jgi:hypothetical protein